ncbi:MAG: metallophosphoesterase family protein [Pseudomonadota bacterium]
MRNKHMENCQLAFSFVASLSGFSRAASKIDRYQFVDLSSDKVGRVVIVSDSHGTVDSGVLAQITADDVVLHAGDIMDVAVIEELENRAKLLVAVAGNNDGALLEGHNLTQPLHEVALIRLATGVLAMEHGHRVWDVPGYHARFRAKYPDVKAVVFGHSHIAAVDTSESPWILNPGASGRIRTHGGASCILLDTLTDKWKVELLKFPKSGDKRHSTRSIEACI